MRTKLLFTLLFLGFSICCFAQKRTITGIVYDEDKNVLADANVLVKNSKKGTITDEKGQFTIDVDGITVIEISYLGFETKEIVIDNHIKIEVILKSKWEEINPVVVIANGKTIVCKKITCSLLWTGGCGVTCEGVLIKENTNNYNNINITLFPNPSANGMFQLQLNESYEKVVTEVYNMNGQLLQSNTYSKLSKIPQIDLSKQPKGMYLIRIVADELPLKTKKAMRL